MGARRDALVRRGNEVAAQLTHESLPDDEVATFARERDVQAAHDVVVGLVAVFQ